MSDDLIPADIVAVTIVEVLCSLALADHLGDVRDAEEKLWDLIGAPKLESSHPAFEMYEAWPITKARLLTAGIPLPSYLADDDDDGL